MKPAPCYADWKGNLYTGNGRLAMVFALLKTKPSYFPSHLKTVRALTELSLQDSQRTFEIREMCDIWGVNQFKFQFTTNLLDLL